MFIDEIIEGFKKRNIRLYSITEIKGGKADVRYITPSSACHNSYSIAKAFTVTALGMLFDEGKLSPDEKVFDILRDSFPEDHDKKWEKVTLHDVMLHKMGLEKGFLDIDVEDIRTYGTHDFLRYAFSKSLPLEVGEKYVYSDAAYYILSRVVASKAGCDMLAYMRPRLFVPLEFQEVAWSVCPFGYSMGATGLYIKTCDMAKLGQVYLDGGAYFGKRIISQEWRDLVFKNGYELKRRPAREAYKKGGMYGQMLYISAEDDCVLAWHAFDKTGGTKDIMDSLGL